VHKKKWNELSPRAQRAVMAVSVVELAVTAWAAVDLIRRDSARVKGPKLLWAGVLIVQPFGPPSYLIFGRK